MQIVNETVTVKKSELIIGDNLEKLGTIISQKIKNYGKPIRFIIVASNDTEYVCEVDLCTGELDDIFTFRKRPFEDTKEFNIAFCVPTGIGAEIGGHCGDANVTVRLFASICDNLITHPNCVNAANYNEQTENTLYVEGSTFTRLFMGTIGLQKARNNKILLLLDKHDNHYFNDEIVNAASTARMTLGVVCDVHIMENVMFSKIEFSESGRASGVIKNLDLLFNEINKFNYDAIALSTSLEAPISFYDDYFINNKMTVNPWGSIEAMITHAVSHRYNIPCAHAPLMSEKAWETDFFGVVDPRKAAESMSVADIYCCLKGLQKSPKIVSPANGLNSKDISCLVIPSGCVGLSVLAAFAQSIPVISVKENANLMKNRFSDYQVPPGILYEVDNYWEALAVCQAIKCGIDPRTLRRPVSPTKLI